MAINKVDFAGASLIDLTTDTVTADTLAEGYTAHAANGEVIVGTMQGAPAGMFLHTVTEDLANASEVKNYFRGVLPDGCDDGIVVYKCKSGETAIDTITERQMLSMTIRGTVVAYTRWYNDAISASSTSTTAYALRCWVGDQYYIFPIY